MITIDERNAHNALPVAIQMLYGQGIQEESRNGPVIRAPEPVVTVLRRPQERLTFYPWRDANPFFLHVEALWMLAGRDDLKQLTPYVKRIADYSDDGGKTSPGAYGKRWRDWEPHWGGDPTAVGAWPDQLNWAVKRLRANPGDRRVVISMWDASVDPERADNGGKDVPCNLMVLPWISDGALHLTVFNRSNDIIWGLYGANAVQFSTLLEYLAGRLGVSMGTLTTLSNNFHAYLETIPDHSKIGLVRSPYIAPQGLEQLPSTTLTDLWSGAKDDTQAERMFQEDLSMLFEYKPEETQIKARSGYIRQVTMPMVLAHKHYRQTQRRDRYVGALEILSQMPLCDWRLAAMSWIEQRYNIWMEKGLNNESA